MNPSTLPAPPLAEVYDVAVIGGGINGVGIAADAAGRGLSVFLCEKDDLASHTSSASSKLIHGGLRYLEHYEFRLVREALAEREVLLAKAPHIVKPMRFVLPHRPHLRPAWMIRAGLFLYDHLGKREKLAGSKSLKFGPDSPLKSEITKGFEYSDCWVDDARLVVLNAMAAREKGAHIHTRPVASAPTAQGPVGNELERADGSLFSIRAKALVNAAGPWVAKFIKDDLKLESPYGIRLIQGSHLIVPKLYEGEHAHILQNEDQRIVFTIPYLNHFTMIGTTDREYTGDPAKVAITEGETDYLLKVVNAHFKKQLSRDDILHSYSGVRPLCNDESDNPSAVTRDYTLALSGGGRSAAAVGVRRQADHLPQTRRVGDGATGAVLHPDAPELDRHRHLPGGEDMTTPQALSARFATSSTGSREIARAGPPPTAAVPGACWKACNRWRPGRTPGWRPLHPRSRLPVREEWATQPQDILWRRTKLGLFTTPQEQDNLQRYLCKVEQNRSKIEAA
jgi:glycerol-3-phosphate dehydrogenase